MIETWGVDAIASGSSSAGLLGTLEGRLVEMEQEGIDQWRYHLLDLSFHRTIVGASNNELAALFFDGCRSAIDRLILQAVSEAQDWSAVRKQLTREHRQIYNALASDRTAKARALVQAHIRKWGARSGQFARLSGSDRSSE
jgi:DNA-binding FadR family transcriptional regulator